MNTRILLRITGIAGFITAAVIAYVFITRILVPTMIPAHINQSGLGSKDLSISQAVVSSIAFFITATTSINAITGLALGWLIEAMVLWALLGALKVRARFIDTWLLSGNYLYAYVVYTVIIATTPLLSNVLSTYLVNVGLTAVNHIAGITVTHRTALSEAPLLMVGLATMLTGSLLLAYAFARIHRVSATKVLLPTLTATAIFWLLMSVLAW
ncbi:hypothetical protein [Vulcanisaeta sp. JCM 14467]|uniref:hypothetical protein n=1 Tax=Vulcanisaeta sp. JCM 14467 TaxID=1295370 RepID=UPI0006D2ABA7|nr:hypothetical protein [Vulcanisaeta sp. JCM 14467]